MDPEQSSLGSSMRVPCVQELVKEPLTAVPPRYMRPDQDPPLISNTTPSQPRSVPVIDFQRLLSEDFMESELQRMDSACKEWGFFQLINHGVSTLLVEDVKVNIQELFNLPLEERENFWQRPGDLEGFGQAFIVSEEQKLDWGDMFYIVTLPKNLRKPYLFPKLPPPLKDSLEAYSCELETLALKLLNLMAKALAMDANEMKEMFEGGYQAMRMNYYPPCPEPELVMGLNQHSDAVGLTILLQVSDVQGLEIRKDGKWVAVKPLPNAFVVNIGDILEIVSNGIYRSIEHRATINSMEERISVATFYSPRIDGELGPAPSLVTQNTPALFERTGVADYFRGIFARKLAGKSNLGVMRIHIGQGNGL